MMSQKYYINNNYRPNAYRYAEKTNSERVKVADKCTENTREGRKQYRQQQIDILEASTTAEKLLYGPFHNLV